MRNIVFFIRRYFNFIFFLILQSLSIYLIAAYNKYHSAVGGVYMNEVTGAINLRYNKIDNFLQLKEKNDLLQKENEHLRNSLAANFESPDTSSKLVRDSIPMDTLGKQRVVLYQRAKVISNSVIAQNNYIVLARGTAQNLNKDEGVIDPANGVVGVVTEISANYAVVMSLLHRDSKINAILKNDPSGGGTVIWDGKEPNYLSFINVRKSAVAKKGDTVITSGITPKFPYGMLIGVIDEISPDKSTNNYIIKLRTTANFYNLQYAYVVKNLQKDEVEKLLENVNNKLK